MLEEPFTSMVLSLEDKVSEVVALLGERGLFGVVSLRREFRLGSLDDV